MSEFFLGEIRLASFASPPKGWALCNGQLLPISQNQALYALLGTAYGGNGQTTFGLPNLQGRVPVASGSGYTVGQLGGEASHTLATAEMPVHNHWPQARSAASNPGVTPTGSVWAAGSSAMYNGQRNTLMNPAAVGTTGAGAGHENRPPYLTLTFMISLVGIFPSRN